MCSSRGLSKGDQMKYLLDIANVNRNHSIQAYRENFSFYKRRLVVKYIHNQIQSSAKITTLNFYKVEEKSKFALGICTRSFFFFFFFQEICDFLHSICFILLQPKKQSGKKYNPFVQYHKVKIRRLLGQSREAKWRYIPSQGKQRESQ